MRMIIFSSQFPELYGGSRPKEYKRMARALERVDIEPIHRFVTTLDRLIRDIEEYKPDLVFAAIDHTTDEDGRQRISPLLEKMKIAYVGSNPDGLNNALSKVKAKEIWARYGIRTPRIFRLESVSDIDDIPPESYPLILKPIIGGGSRGITEDNVFYTGEQLKRRLEELISQSKSGLFAERYIHGREFTISIMGNGKGKIIAPSELVPRKGSKPIVITHRMKEGIPGTRPIEPEPLHDKPLRDRLAEFAERMYDACSLRDYGRADVIMDDEGRLYAIEINGQPVFESYYLTGFKGLGMDYEAVVAGVIYASIRRWRSEGMDLPVPSSLKEILPPEILRRLSRK